MFKKLKALFRRKKPEQPKPQPYGLSRPMSAHSARSLGSTPAAPITRRDDSNDLLTPLNPMGIFSPIWHSSTPAHTDCKARESNHDSRGYCGSDSGSSSDSGSISGCD